MENFGSKSYAEREKIISQVLMLKDFARVQLDQGHSFSETLIIKNDNTIDDRRRKKNGAEEEFPPVATVCLDKSGPYSVEDVYALLHEFQKIHPELDVKVFSNADKREIAYSISKA